MRITKPVRRMIAAVVTIIMVATLTVNAFAIDYNSGGCDPGCPVCTEASRTSNWVNTKTTNTRRASYDAVPAATSFSDVPDGHTFATGIMYCADKGIVGGYTDGTFRPANTVSRSNFVVMLSRAFYADAITEYTNDFTTSFSAFMPNYLALKNNGIWNNVSFDTDDPYNSGFITSMNLGISRYDMAQLMTNIMSKNGFSASSADKSAAIAKITDYNNIPSQYRDAVANVYALGVIGGFANGTFGGDSTMNRGQGATVIYRMLAKMGETGTEKPTPDPEAPVDPGTGEIACACVELTGECKCCNTTDTATKPNTPETPVDPKPETPVTPSGNTLTNGKAITEANVTEILNQLRAQYPAKTDAGVYTMGNSSPVRQVSLQYTRANGSGTSSTKSGCGGWTARVFDAIFGTNATLRKTTLANAKPGDVLVKLNDKGQLMHLCVVVEKITATHPYVVNYGMTWAIGGVMTTDAGAEPDINKTIWDVTYAPDGNYDIWTAYPN